MNVTNRTQLKVITFSKYMLSAGFCLTMLRSHTAQLGNRMAGKPQYNKLVWDGYDSTQQLSSVCS